METNLSVDKDLAQQFANRNRSPNSFIFLRESDSWFIIQSNQCLVLVNPEVEDLLARVENTKCLVRFHIFPKLQTYDYNHDNHNNINIIDLGKDITIHKQTWLNSSQERNPSLSRSNLLNASSTCVCVTQLSTTFSLSFGVLIFYIF